MPASTEQKVDFLLKKIGYSASKTGGVEGSSGTVDGTKKKPSEEAIPSPLIVPSTSLWSDSVSIPATPPGSDTFPVKVYATASAYRLTVDNSVSESRSFIARSTYGNASSSIDGDWIDSQFGADYSVRVFKGDPNSGGVELSQAGATGNDTWFFDYSSGILNFTGTDNHSTIGVTDTNIYILGYRYTGGKGSKPPSGIGTFSSLYVTGISTFVGLVDINGGGQANTFKVEDLTAGRVVLAGTGGEIEDSGNLTFDANSNLTVTGGVKVTGVSTFSNDIRASANLSVTGISTLGSIGISTGLISGPAITYIDPATVGDNTGLLVVKGNLQVDGTQTTVNSATMTVTDKNIVVAQGSANDAASDGAGITVDAGSDTDKTFNWVDATDAWTSSEHIQVAAGKRLGFADDPNTYIDSPSADQIDFTTGGTERLKIESNGYVTLPWDSSSQYTLLRVGDVSGTSEPQIQLYTDTSANTAVVNSRNNHDLTLRTNNTEKVRITKDGKVGIGTVNPQSELHVYKGDASVYTKIESASGASTLELRHTNKYGSLNYYYQGTHKWLFGQVNQDSDISLYQPTGVAAGQNAYRILVKANGNIGIHSTTPTTTLDVNGSVRTNHLNVTGITTSATLNVGVSGQTLVGISTILDEDNMASDSAAALATQQSIKAYVDTQVTAQDLDFAGDSGTGAVDLDSQSLTLAGTSNEIETSASGQTITLGLPNDVTIGNDLTVTRSLNVAGFSTFVGLSTFNNDVNLIGGVAGITSAYWDQSAASFKFLDNVKLQFGDSQDLSLYHGVTASYLSHTGTGNLYIDSDTVALRKVNQHKYFLGQYGVSYLYHTDTQRLKTTGTGVEISDDIKVAGISTFAGNVDVNASADISGNLVVGAAGTTITTTVGAAASVGIGTANPAYMLDVAGAINSSNDVKINGTSVLTSALNEAVAMAIALG